MHTNNTSVTMPVIGFGTYLIPDEEAPRTVNSAIKIGYRHIDTAEVYRNEGGIGLGLKKSLSQFSLNRDDIFITVGSSGAFLLTFLTCFDPGNRVAIFSPTYPAYKNILSSVNIEVIEIHSKKTEDIFKSEVYKYLKKNGYDLFSQYYMTSFFKINNFEIF